MQVFGAEENPSTWARRASARRRWRRLRWPPRAKVRRSSGGRSSLDLAPAAEQVRAIEES